MFKFLKENMNKFALFVFTLLVANPAFAEDMRISCLSAPSLLFYCVAFENKEFYQKTPLGDIILKISAFFIICVLALMAIVSLKTKISHTSFFQKANYKKLFKMFLKANIISVVIMFLLVLIQPKLLPILGLFSPLLCYFLEYKIIRKTLLEDYKNNYIETGLLKLNLLFFILSPVLTFIFGLIAGFMGI